MMVMRCRRAVDPELTVSSFSLAFFWSISAVVFVVVVVLLSNVQRTSYFFLRRICEFYS